MIGTASSIKPCPVNQNAISTLLESEKVSAEQLDMGMSYLPRTRCNFNYPEAPTKRYSLFEALFTNKGELCFGLALYQCNMPQPL